MKYILDENYLRDLELDEYSDRINEIVLFYENLNIEIRDIFISEYTTGDGKRVFESLWLFNDSKMMESKKFMSEDYFDLIEIDTFVHWVLKKENFDFQNDARLNSKMYLALYSGLNEAQFKATGKNCDKLKQIFKNYIVPNL